MSHQKINRKRILVLLPSRLQETGEILYLEIYITLKFIFQDK